MDLLLIDDEWLVLEQFELEMEGIDWINIKGKCASAQQGLTFLKTTTVDVVVVDVEMGGMSGLEFAEVLRTTYPEILVIFVTGYDHYALEAFQKQAFGYLLKPFNRQEMLSLLEKAQCFHIPESKLRIVTFGRFDVFYRNESLTFHNAKAKELLALCVDRYGGSVSMEEAVDKLWPERPYDDRVKNLYRKAVTSLRNALSEIDQEHIFYTGRGFCYLKTEQCICDYYEYLKRGHGAYDGLYMFEYEWAEETNAKLSQGQ